MIPLNLPTSDFRFKELYGKKAIYDILRKKFVILTPEEWVRQHLIHFLINQYKYPKSLIKIETGLTYNEIGGRSDIIVYNREGKVFMLVECKAAEIQLTDSVFRQAGRYNQKYKAEHLAVTNGINHYCCRIDYTTGNYQFLDDFPVFT
jgi:hypothetical protein